MYEMLIATEASCPECVLGFLHRGVNGKLKCPECGYTEEDDG